MTDAPRIRVSILSHGYVYVESKDALYLKIETLEPKAFENAYTRTGETFMLSKSRVSKHANDPGVIYQCEFTEDRKSIFLGTAKREGLWHQRDEVREIRAMSQTHTLMAERKRGFDKVIEHHDIKSILLPLRHAYRHCRNYREQTMLLALVMAYVTADVPE